MLRSLKEGAISTSLSPQINKSIFDENLIQLNKNIFSNSKV